MLLTIDEIKKQLDDQFLPLEPSLTGFRMVTTSTTKDELKKLERSLNTKFPSQFRKLLLRYDFGKLTIGPIVFGNTGDYCKIIEQYNLGKETNWWAGGGRPNYIVMIANSDPYAICLNCETGQVLAFHHEQSLNENVIISSSFEMFLRGVGTVFFNRTKVYDHNKLATQVVQETSSLDSKFSELKLSFGEDCRFSVILSISLFRNYLFF